MAAAFIRTVEDFTCEQCGYSVKGNGYTNHCPECLWSKHVDNEPGDRAARCNGLMEPTSIVQKGNEVILEHTCTVCGHKKNNKAAAQDNAESLIVLSKVLSMR